MQTLANPAILPVSSIYYSLGNLFPRAIIITCAAWLLKIACKPANMIVADNFRLSCGVWDWDHCINLQTNTDFFIKHSNSSLIYQFDNLISKFPQVLLLDSACDLGDVCIASVSPIASCRLLIRYETQGFSLRTVIKRVTDTLTQACLSSLCDRQIGENAAHNNGLTGMKCQL